MIAPPPLSAAVASEARLLLIGRVLRAFTNGYVAILLPAYLFILIGDPLVEAPHEWFSALIGLGAALALFRYKAGIMAVIGACAAVGSAYTLVLRP